MTQLQARSLESNSDASRKRQSKRRRLAWNLSLQALAVVAIALLVYPHAADWFSRIGQGAEITGYVKRVKHTPSEERQRILRAAYAYNDELQPGPLTDPYISVQQDAERGGSLYQAYENMLRVSGTDAIGTLSYPRVGIGLPLYHGTLDKTISKGVGHMYGTSLPIGGPSTRSVLTSHSGLPNASLFTPLHKANVDDTFWISVLGEDHYYRVEHIETIEPGNTESFKIVENEDWVTLFTCTPVGVNSHRLLVHAARISGSEAAQLQNGDENIVSPGFPWWALWFVGGSAVVGYILFVPRRRR